MTKVAIIEAGPCGLSMLRSFEQKAISLILLEVQL